MKLQVLKILVIGMGVMIFVGLGFLAYGIAQKFSAPKPDAGAAATAVKPFAPLSLTLPKGASIAETTLDGDRLLLRLALPDGSARLLVFDLASGRQIGTIVLKRDD